MKSDRYARQMILPEIGEVGQEKLRNASVLCVGAGGLGCPALLYLAAAGVGHIGVMDYDVIDETNLHRQILYTMHDIGQNKAETAKVRLYDLNPDIQITAYAMRLTAQNAEKIISQYDLILDGSDNFTTKYLVNDVCVKNKKPYIYGAVLGYEGHVAVFDPTRPESACYRCLFPFTDKRHVPNCNEAGVIGAAAGIIGTMQAMEAIKMILRHEHFTPLRDTLMAVDTRDMRIQKLQLGKDKNCPVCHKHKKEEICLMDEPTTFTCGVVSEISPDEAKAMKAAVFVDVREDDEWAAGHIDGAHHLPLSKLLDGRVTPADLGLKKDQEIILYCRSGQRSLHAGHVLIGHGYGKVYNLTGGILGWN